MCFILQQCPPTEKTRSELVAHIYERISKSEVTISEPKQALITAINQNMFVGGKEESVSIVRHNLLVAQFVITDLIRERKQQRIFSLSQDTMKAPPTLIF